MRVSCAKTPSKHGLKLTYETLFKIEDVLLLLARDDLQNGTAWI
jgi:hypothetical protein